MSCHVFVYYACFIFTVPPYSPIDPAATADYTAVGYDYVVNDSTPTVELLGKQCPFTSPTYRLSLYTLSIALCIVDATFTFLFECIACHCRHLLDFPLSHAALYKYYTSVCPALC